MGKRNGSGSSDPMAAFRKEQKKKQGAKNARARKESRKAHVLVRSPAAIKAEIERLQKQAARTPGGLSGRLKVRLSVLEKNLPAAIQKQKEDRKKAAQLDQNIRFSNSVSNIFGGSEEDQQELQDATTTDTTKTTTTTTTLNEDEDEEFLLPLPPLPDGPPPPDLLPPPMPLMPPPQLRRPRPHFNQPHHPQPDQPHHHHQHQFHNNENPPQTEPSSSSSPIITSTSTSTSVITSAPPTIPPPSKKSALEFVPVSLQKKNVNPKDDDKDDELTKFWADLDSTK